jgi:hypothetical protein
LHSCHARSLQPDTRDCWQDGCKEECFWQSRFWVDCQAAAVRHGQRLQAFDLIRGHVNKDRIAASTSALKMLG